MSTRSSASVPGPAPNAGIDEAAKQQYRAHFDARVRFGNGGRLDAYGFRLDVPSEATPRDRIGQLFIRHLGLSMVESVELSDLVIVEEAHKGSRGVEDSARPPSLVDLSHAVPWEALGSPSRHDHSALSAWRVDTATRPPTSIVVGDGRSGVGDDLEHTSLVKLAAIQGEVFHLTDLKSRSIPPGVFYEREVAGRAVLLDTGWSPRFGTPLYCEPAPFLSREAADYLICEGVTMVGIDTSGLDDSAARREAKAMVRTTLLQAGVVLLENVTNVDLLPASGSRIVAAPPALAGMHTCPVRAFALVGEGA
ncbi:cyclase family protein [Agromyces silvae]|uniref:cyclase family protein n=1 Tax=Agromyces silvae TaxID=3388266 RepID=UPI00280B6703|nr:cyclase family protein [Agromyces protaetiae]